MLQIFGHITNPYPTGYAGGIGTSFGLILFFNNLLKLITVVGGIFSFLQILMAGFGFISAGGDAKQIANCWNKIWQAGLGLVIIAVSFVLAAIFGFLILGDASAILSPNIYGPNP